MLQRQLRILQIISSSATSGAERHVVDLSRSLIERGHVVEIFCPEEGWLPQAATEAGIKTHIHSMKGKGWLETQKLIWERTNRVDFDVFHTHLTRAAYVGLSAGFLNRVPVVASVHIANNDSIYKRLAHGKNKVVAVSGFVAGMLHGRGVPKRFIETIFNGTDFLNGDPADPVEVKKELGIRSDKRLIALIGKLHPDKGQIQLIEAMAKIVEVHPEAHAILVGKGDAEYDQAVAGSIQAHGLGESITLTGLRSDISRLLDASEVVAIPSRMETFGLAAIEAMARSKPVVATRVGALPEIVQDRRTGLLIDLNTLELADAIKYLLSEKYIRDSMGASARLEVAKRFALPDMVSRFESLYQSCRK